MAECSRDEDSRSPMDVKDELWIYHRSEEIISKYPEFMTNPGKWMLFYDQENINDVWRRAKALYDAGDLDGIRSMKVSTNTYNPRAEVQTTKVIIFYCGPASDENKMTRYGRNILKYINYTKQMRERNSPQYMMYKPDYMTFAGTRATGQKLNHIYQLPFSWNSQATQYWNQKPAGQFLDDFPFDNFD